MKKINCFFALLIAVAFFQSTISFAEQTDMDPVNPMDQNSEMQEARKIGNKWYDLMTPEELGEYINSLPGLEEQAEALAGLPDDLAKQVVPHVTPVKSGDKGSSSVHEYDFSPLSPEDKKVIFMPPATLPVDLGNPNTGFLPTPNLGPMTETVDAVSEFGKPAIYVFPITNNPLLTVFFNSGLEGKKVPPSGKCEIHHPWQIPPDTDPAGENLQKPVVPPATEGPVPGPENWLGYVPEPPVADRVLDIMNKSVVSPQDAAWIATFATAAIVVWQTIKAAAATVLNTTGGFLMMPMDFEKRYMGSPGRCSIDEEDAAQIYCSKDGKEYLIRNDRDGIFISQDGKDYVLNCFEISGKDMMACKFSPVDA